MAFLRVSSLDVSGSRWPRWLGGRRGDGLTDIELMLDEGAAGLDSIQIAEAKNAHVEARKSECRGATAQGRQFHAKAEADMKSGNFAGAIQNLQMALTFEPANAGFKALVDELKEKQKAGN